MLRASTFQSLTLVNDEWSRDAWLASGGDAAEDEDGHSLLLAAAAFGQSFLCLASAETADGQRLAHGVLLSAMRRLAVSQLTQEEDEEDGEDDDDDAHLAKLRVCPRSALASRRRAQITDKAPSPLLGLPGLPAARIFSVFGGDDCSTRRCFPQWPVWAATAIPYCCWTCKETACRAAGRMQGRAARRRSSDPVCSWLASWPRYVRRWAEKGPIWAGESRGIDGSMSFGHRATCRTTSLPSTRS